MPLVGMDGKPLIPTPPPGFYLGMLCPVCNMPIFYHGGGRYIVPESAMGPAHDVEVQTVLFPTCTHPIDPNTVSVEVPGSYDLLTERNSISKLFAMWGSVYDAYQTAVEQLGEFLEERKLYEPYLVNINAQLVVESDEDDFSSGNNTGGEAVYPGNDGVEAQNEDNNKEN